MLKSGYKWRELVDRDNSSPLRPEPKHGWIVELIPCVASLDPTTVSSILERFRLLDEYKERWDGLVVAEQGLGCQEPGQLAPAREW